MAVGGGGTETGFADAWGFSRAVSAAASFEAPFIAPFSGTACAGFGFACTGGTGGRATSPARLAFDRFPNIYSVH